MDLSGVVTVTGASVTRFQPGDEVFGIGKGAFADYACAPENKLALKPPALSFEQAAAVPISGLTALQAVRNHGKVQQGDHVLVTGASGGVGGYAVQLAKAYGATVTGVCSAAKADFVKQFGADTVLDYRSDDFTDTAPYDVILDVAGNATLRKLRHAATPKGRIVIVGGETDGRWLGGTDRQLRAMLLAPFIGQSLKVFINSEKVEDLITLADLAAAGKFIPSVDRVFPLHQTAAAVRYLEEGAVRGKTVISMTG